MKRVPISCDGRILTETSIDVGDAVEFVLESGLSIPTVVAENTYSCTGCVFLPMDSHLCPINSLFDEICNEKNCVFLPVEQLI